MWSLSPFYGRLSGGIEFARKYFRGSLFTWASNAIMGFAFLGLLPDDALPASISLATRVSNVRTLQELSSMAY